MKRKNQALWMTGLVVIILALPIAYFVWPRFTLRQGVADAFNSSSSVVVIWSGWHPPDFEQRGFRLENEELDLFAAALRGNLGVRFPPSESLARPRITVWFYDEAEKPFAVALFRKSLNSKTTESIDQLVEIVQSGLPLNKSEIKSTLNTKVSNLSSYSGRFELVIE